jgi:hypothetical protein
MPLDVLGRTRVTLTEPTSSFPCSKELGNLVKLCRAGERIARGPEWRRIARVEEVGVMDSLGIRTAEKKTIAGAW